MGRMVTKINVGMIGYNDGNGHPFSFSAIINGYDPVNMEKCPYPTIKAYLSLRSKEEFGVGSLSVTHVWCPERSMAELIASCTFIDNVVNRYEDMIEAIDVVIIARDDADSHRKIAEPFLKSGKIVFIDKPLCKTVEDLEFFTPFLKSGQLMSCSGFRYHPLYLDKAFITQHAGNVVAATAITTVDWFKYGIHMLDGIQPMMNSSIDLVNNVGEDENDIVRIRYKNGKDAVLIKKDTFRSFAATFYTSTGEHIIINFTDNFTYFRNMLIDVEKFVAKGAFIYRYEDTISLINALIAANLSKTLKQAVKC